MSRRLALALVLLPTALLAACASQDDRRAAAAAAHACHIQFPNPNQEAQYDACVVQMESNIRDARAYHKEPEHPQGGGHGGGHRGGGGNSGS